jgi:glycosyltransferase involved in cell wall biosynthesis
MRLVHLPALRVNTVETLSHTAVSVAHSVVRPCDVAVVFNAANAPLLPGLRARRIPVAVHVDGLEWQRGKWGPTGQRYYRIAERLAVRWGDALIADARGIQDYYMSEHLSPSWFIPYGAPDTTGLGTDRLASCKAVADGYHLVVARLVPENHVDLVIDGFIRSEARLPLLVVGGASYNDGYARRIADLAARDSRVRLLGSVWDQVLLDQLYVHARTYLHGHSVGGTNPSLLRAAGGAAAVIAFDVAFNREVLGSDGRYFSGPMEVAAAVEAAERDPAGTRQRGQSAHASLLKRYDWDEVAKDYERLCLALHRRAAWIPPADLGPRITAGIGSRRVDDGSGEP